MFAIVGVCVLCTWMLLRHTDEEPGQDLLSEQIEPVAEEVFTAEVLHEDVLEGIVLAGTGVRDALALRPEEMELSAEAAAEFAEVDSVRVGSGNVTISVTSPGLLKSDDKYYYLFEEMIWEDGPAADAEPVSKCYKDAQVSFTLDMKRGTTASRLFSRFYVAVKQGVQKGTVPNSTQSNLSPRQSFFDGLIPLYHRAIREKLRSCSGKKPPDTFLLPSKRVPQNAA